MGRFWKMYVNAYRGLSRAAWMLALVMLINRTGAMVLPFLGVYMTNALHFSIRETGIVLACFGFGAVTGSWLGGWLTDRLGNFAVQAVSLLLAVPVFALLPLFHTVEGLAAGIFVLSVITETFRPANSVSVARYARPENITRAFSLNRMAINLGFSIGPAMAGFLATLSYSWIFYGNALASFLAAALFIAYFRRLKAVRPARQHIKASAESGPVQRRSPYRDIRFLVFSFLCCLYAVCFFQLLSTLPLFYQMEHGLDEKAIGYLLAFSGIVVVLFEMPLVHISERRLGNRASIVLGTLLCAGSFLLLPATPAHWILYASIFLLSISEILAMPFMSAVSAERASRQTLGAYMGLNALAFSVAHVISPFAGTYIADHWGFSVLWYVSAALLIVVSAGYFTLLRRWR